jgi:uncharacterized membrane protein YgcG
MPAEGDPAAPRFDAPGTLLVELETPLDVNGLTSALSAFERAYESLFVYFRLVDRASRLARVKNRDALMRALYDFESYDPYRPEPRLHYWRAFQVPSESRLELTHVRAESLGYAVLRGASGPLETLRKYGKNRDDRRKDREWREALERERMEIENDLARAEAETMKTAAVRERYELWKDILGVDEARRIAAEQIGVAGEALDVLSATRRRGPMPAIELGSDDAEDDDGESEGGPDEQAGNEGGDSGGGGGGTGWGDGGGDDGGGKDSDPGGGEDEFEDDELDEDVETVDAYSRQSDDAVEPMPAV